MRKNIIFLAVLLSSTILSATVTEEVITNTTVTQDTTVTIITPPEPEEPDAPEDEAEDDEPDTPPPLPPEPPVTVVHTENITSTFNNTIVKNEGDADKKMSFQITFDNPLPADIRLVYYINKVSSGFVLGSDVDKTVRENFLQLSKGTTSATIDINVIDDTLAEEDEKFDIALRLPGEYVTYSDGSKDYGDYSYKHSDGTITDNDSALLVNVTAPVKVSLSEAEAATKDMEIKLEFSKPLDKDSRLDYVITPNDITLGEDIANTSRDNAVYLSKGDTSKTIKIKVLDDNLYEQTEYFQIKYYPVDKNLHFSPTYTNAEILDDEISVTISDYVIFSEDQANKDKMKFNIAFSKEIPNDLVLDYKLDVGPSLVLGQDIANVTDTGSITVPKGSKSATIEITVKDDDIIEDAEYFNLVLQQPAGSYGFINDTSIGVILDDDIKIDIPTNGGDYYIYESDTTDPKLKTKIVNKSASYDVYASDGFEIFLGETEEDEKVCDDPDCSTVTQDDGQIVEQCVVTCYITTTTVLKYSNSMNIDTITLRTFKDYNPSTNQCYGEYPKQIVDSNISLDSGGKHTFSIPTDKAFRCGWIEVDGHSDEDVNGTVTDFHGVSDAFAMRPDRFSVDMEGKNLTNPLVAGNNIDMKIMAVDGSSNIVNSYSGSNFVEQVTDKYYGDSLNKGLNINGLSFISGLIQQTTKYDEVGELTISISEGSPAFAEIDKNDNPNSYLITPASYQLRVVPDHFSISYVLQDKDSADKLTFIASDPNLMGASINYSVTAENSLGNITQRYNAGEYADNVNINISQIANTTPARDLTLNYQSSKKSDSNTFTSSANTNLDDVLNESDFHNGIASDVVVENFTRNNTQAQNPIQLSVDKLSAQEQTGVGGVKTYGEKSDPAQNVNFYYARAHVSSPQIVEGDDLKANVYYEVYCENCDKSVFINASGLSSVDSIYWYILPNSVVSTFGPSVCDYNNPRALDSSTITSITHNSVAELEVKTSTIPSKNKIFYTPVSTFLQYNRFGTSLPEHFFEVSFISAANKWAGEGEIGSTVDTNISKNVNQSLQW